VASDLAAKVDWPTALAPHDLVWKRLPTKWEESPFLGNGWMGTMLYLSREAAPVKEISVEETPVNTDKANDAKDRDAKPKPRPYKLRLDVHHAGVCDQQPGDGTFGTSRLMIGYFQIETVGEPTACDLRLDLWNAELTGSVTTKAGKFHLRVVVPADQQLIALEATPDAGEQALRVTFHPLRAISPRALKRKREDWPEEYQENPPHELLSQGEVEVCRQPLTAGGEYATVWQESDGATKTMFASVAQTFPQEGAVEQAAETVRQAAKLGYDGLLPSHRQWWHSYYPTSFVSIPDPHWQSFYAIQMYKLGAATRANGCLIDNHGPWVQATSWPYATWNLNVQLSYWAYYASGHLREAQSLPRHISEHRANLGENVTPEEFRHDSYVIGRAATENLRSPLRTSSHGDLEIGNLPWALHDVWLHYRHTMNDELLRETLFPVLKGSINYYLHLLEEGDDGKLHLPETYSPEYGLAVDCNYDLALLRWGCQTLLRINNRLELNDPKAGEWQRVLDNLTNYPGDAERGYYIGRDVPYAKSHRHYSHLLMIYPLYTVNVDQPGGREQIEKCVANWHSLPKQLLGYSFTGSASMYAALGDGDRALAKLNGLKRFLLPNTMYREGGPVIETPLSAAQSIHDMLIQSWGDRIRIFPAVPSGWQEVTFYDLRTEGAFEVSAVREAGETKWVRVKSLAGEPFELQPNITGDVEVSDGGVCSQIEPGLYKLTLAKGDVVTLRRADYRGDPQTLPKHQSQQGIFGLQSE